MPKLYELSLDMQRKRLRNTAVASVVIGMSIGYVLASHGHWTIALLVAIITAQVATGSIIMMNDVKRDLQEVQRAATINR